VHAEEAPPGPERSDSDLEHAVDVPITEHKRKPQILVPQPKSKPNPKKPGGKRKSRLGTRKSSGPASLPSAEPSAPPAEVLGGVHEPGEAAETRGEDAEVGGGDATEVAAEASVAKEEVAGSGEAGVGLASLEDQGSLGAERGGGDAVKDASGEEGGGTGGGVGGEEAAQDTNGDAAAKEPPAEVVKEERGVSLHENAQSEVGGGKASQKADPVAPPVPQQIHAEKAAKAVAQLSSSAEPTAAPQAAEAKMSTGGLGQTAAATPPKAQATALETARGGGGALPAVAPKAESGRETVQDPRLQPTAEDTEMADAAVEPLGRPGEEGQLYAEGQAPAGEREPRPRKKQRTAGEGAAMQGELLRIGWMVPGNVTWGVVGELFVCPHQKKQAAGFDWISLGTYNLGWKGIIMFMVGDQCHG